ncbi:cysteine hydrolase family protein [Streptomyces candidus]|uniref:Nicotinamidase-related amidase n=1 Tax=Streptomyces candidus TaxID=67283 RepID=A0A7X0HE57_9ACTN|nr:cysteine hydrolase family protein [Streptomyces candidus]MBB6434632.1 nicotinamidase-related amidase [Streptomyces candidus]GHH35985.1 hydrolase [Streptomyces candidus]
MNTQTPPVVTQDTALVVVDVQQGLEESEHWGRRNNPAADAHIETLLDVWQTTGRPVVLVRHDSVEPLSPLRPGQPGNGFKGYVEERRGLGAGPQLLVTKTVNSAFYGTPDLDAWFRASGITRFVVVGIQTNMCVETTARMGGNLGYEVLFALDATYTFDLEGPFGWRQSADELARATAVTLHGGGFATVTTTAELVAAAKR